MTTLTEKIKEILPKVTEEYDGNNLESACDAYCMAAENWAEIIRYENGRMSYRSEVIELIPKILEIVREEIKSIEVSVVVDKDHWNEKGRREGNWELGYDDAIHDILSLLK